MTPYYDRDGITIYCGDCLEVMPGLDGDFDAIIADLPYGTTACSWDTVIPLDALWAEYKRLIKDRGAVVLFGSQPFTSRLISSNYDWFKYEWIWSKNKGSGFINSKNRPIQSHENIIVFSPGTIANCSNSRMIYNPQGLKRDPYWKKRNKPMTANPNGFLGTRPSHTSEYQVEYQNYPNTVIGDDIKHHNGGLYHPTQKPVALLSYLIRTYTNPAEIILDNTMGSGTTLVAAQNEGRRATGIETSEEYCKIAVERLRQPSFFSIPNQTNGKAKAEQARLID